ncbi:hypothetical protein DFH09DRAFT_896986 [Mycena vulgaris]|nr:hypothetical protein DFH09DRAFT_896986 [Mycena vulgaris]
MEASAPPSIPISRPSPASRSSPAKIRQNVSWNTLLPQLVAPLVAYRLASRAQRPPAAPETIQHICTGSCPRSTTLKLQCLYISRLFPTAPKQPRFAISIDLLDIYRALFERSCDAVTALAAALHTIYRRCGFKVLSREGNYVKDPYREGLGSAIQWYSNLRSVLQRETEAVLSDAQQSLLDDRLHPEFLVTVSTDASEASSAATGPLSECVSLCSSALHSLTIIYRGGDIQLGSDGCFSYRHLRSAGDGPISYDPAYFLSKEKVDAIGDKLTKARSKKPSAYTFPIPKEAVDACEASWTAANEKKLKSDPGRYDSHGIFVTTCRHSQVLFLCNIDTPGEQQKYLIAAMEEVASMLPPEATMTQCYDVACVTDQSVYLFPLLSTGLLERVCFVINAMHAYGHQWVCQVVYSPRLHKGMGLTDAEGVERFWSRIRKLIGITRNQWNSKRIWMIDQYAEFVSEDGRNKLGDWIQRQTDKNFSSKKDAANKILQECGISRTELRVQWEQQKAAQTSLRSHAPARLKRELDKVLGLQAQIDTVDKSIAEVKQSITAGDASAESISLLRGLEVTHSTLNTQAEALYASLNIQAGFPELRGLPLEFVRILLMARDLKMNIRKRAVGTFYEWETLDRAVGGRHEALGTKLHQSTRRAISRRKPALLKAIRKYNEYCAQLEQLIPAACPLPLPQALSTELNGLRDDPTLHDDVWIVPAEGGIPRWLDDADVRDGIRALHSSDRCHEEWACLDLERENMSRWLTEEISVVSRALETHGHSHLSLPLHQRQEYLEFLLATWAPALTSLTNAHIPTTSSSSSLSSQYEDNDSNDYAVIFDPRLSHVEAADELEPGDTSESEEVITVQDTLNNDDDENDTTAIDLNRLNFTLLTPIESRSTTRVVVPQDGRPRCEIEASDWARIQSPTGRLNGHLLNGLAASLLNILSHPTSMYTESASKCAVLSTYDLPRVRYHASDAELWRHVSPSRYWEKDLWLIPIHRPNEEHWVLVVASIRQQQLWFFDSFSQRRGWRPDLQDVMRLITRMVILANRNQHSLPVSTEEDAWIARPFLPLVSLRH